MRASFVFVLLSSVALAQNATWQSYVLAPSSRSVLPVTVLHQSTTGVSNAGAFIGTSSTPARLTAAASQQSWPAGTSATASSVHPPNAGNGGATRTYAASNAIDGTTATFFNDNTEGDSAGTDWVLITSPSAVTASGITIVSSVDGFIENFTVETSADGSHFSVQANVTNNGSIAPFVAFPASASFTSLRINVTHNQDAGKGVFTRIAELVLGQFIGDAAWPANTTASASSTHAPNSDQPSYAASNAIDGNQATFWNDDTESVYPDILTILSGDVVVLPGITLISNADGSPSAFIVETSADGTNWSQQASITGNTAITISVPFPAPVSALGVRITVTNDNNNGKGVFTRVAELLPRLTAPVPFVDLDFGKVVAGRLRLVIAAASNPPPQLRLAFSETQEFLGFASDYSPSDYTVSRHTDDLVPTPAGETWVDMKQCQFADGTVCADGLRGFRYVRVYIQQTPGAESHSAVGGTVDFAPSGVSVNFTPFLGTPDTFKGHFLCNDDLLNKIWFAAAYTVELDTDTFSADTVDPRGAFSSSLDGKIVQFDGAKRDRDPYSGDIAVSSLVDLVSHANIQGQRNVLLDLALHQRSDGWIPPASIQAYGLTLFDYPAWWAIASGDLVLYTADNAFATQIWPVLVKLMDGWYPTVTNSAGLLDKSGTTYVNYGDYAFLPRHGVITYYNANYVRALRSASLIATFLGHTSNATTWSARADSTSAAIAASDLFDATAGAWLDSGANGITHTCHSQDATAFAILSNSSTAARTTSSLAFLTNTLKRTWGNAFVDQDCFGGGTSDRVYNFISHPEVMARFQAGDAAGALELIRRSWGFQVTRDPVGTFWEATGTNGDVANYEGAFTSMAHGWAAGAAIALSTRVLGIQPTSPGFKTYDVAPQPGDLQFANGTMPTPSGIITVGWTVDSTGKLHVDVSGPAGTVANVRVPVTSSTKRGMGAQAVLLNGEIVWSAGGQRERTNTASFDGENVYVTGLAGGCHHSVTSA